MSRVFVALVVVLLLVCQVWSETVDSSSSQMVETDTASFIDTDEAALVDADADLEVDAAEELETDAAEQLSVDADEEALVDEEAHMSALLEAAAEAEAELEAEADLAKGKQRRVVRKGGNKRGNKRPRKVVKVAPTAAPPGTPTLTQLKLYRQLGKAHEGMYEKILKSYNRPPLDAKHAQKVALYKEMYNYYFMNKYNRQMQKNTVDLDLVKRMIATKNPDIDCIDCKIESSDDHLENIPDVIRVEERHDGKLVKVLTGNAAIIDLAGKPKERVKNLKNLIKKALKTGSLKLDEMSAITMNKYLTKNDVLAAPKKKKAKKAKKAAKKVKRSKKSYTNRDLVKPFGGMFKHIKGKFNLKDVQAIYDHVSTGVDATNAMLERVDNKHIGKISNSKGIKERYTVAPVYTHMSGPTNTLAKAVGEAPAFFY